MATTFPTGTYGHMIVNTPGIVHFMRLNESSGTSVVDDVGSLTGTRVGPLVGQTGALAGDPSKSYRFDGINDYVTFGNNVPLTGNFSVELWVMPTLTYVSTATRSFLSKENYTSPVSGWGYYLTGMKPTFVRMANGTQYRVSCSDISPNVWTHLVTTYDGSTLRQYKNGTLVWDTPSPGSIYTSAYQFTMGCATNGQMADNYDFFNGYIDELAIYNTPLSATTILNHYNRGKTSPIQTLSLTNNDNIAVTESRTVNAFMSLSDLRKINRVESYTATATQTLTDAAPLTTTELIEIEATFAGTKAYYSDARTIGATETMSIFSTTSVADSNLLLSAGEDRLMQGSVALNDTPSLTATETSEPVVVVRASVAYPQIVKRQSGFVSFVVSRNIHVPYVIQYRYNDVVPVGSTTITPFIVIDNSNNPLAVGFSTATWSNTANLDPVVVEIDLNVDDYPEILASFGFDRKDRD